MPHLEPHLVAVSPTFDDADAQANVSTVGARPIVFPHQVARYERPNQVAVEYAVVCAQHDPHSARLHALAVNEPDSAPDGLADVCEPVSEPVQDAIQGAEQVSL